MNKSVKGVKGKVKRNKSGEILHPKWLVFLSQINCLFFYYFSLISFIRSIFKVKLSVTSCILKKVIFFLRLIFFFFLPRSSFRKVVFFFKVNICILNWLLFKRLTIHLKADSSKRFCKVDVYTFEVNFYFRWLKFSDFWFSFLIDSLLKVGSFLGLFWIHVCNLFSKLLNWLIIDYLLLYRLLILR